MQQGADHIFLILAVPVGEGGRLQAMGQPVHLETAKVAVKQPEMIENPVRVALGKLPVALADLVPVLLGALFHVGEGGALFRADGHIAHALTPHQ